MVQSGAQVRLDGEKSSRVLVSPKCLRAAGNSFAGRMFVTSDLYRDMHCHKSQTVLTARNGFPVLQRKTLSMKLLLLVDFASRVSLFPGFKTSWETRNFSELDDFAFFFWFSVFQISFLPFCYVVLTNLVQNLQFFQQTEKKILISQAFQHNKSCKF